MTAGFAFLATAIATLFALATLRRATTERKPHQGAWTVALAMFALASAALATGTSTGWDPATFRIFYLLGAVTNVPWLALGTVFLLVGPAVGRRVQWGLVFFTGLATGAVLMAPLDGPVPRTTIPVGSELFGPFPRVLAALGSGLGALVLLGGALWSAVRFARRRSEPGSGRLAASSLLIALGTLVLSAAGLAQGPLGIDRDEAFSLSLTVGITVIYVGFVTGSSRSTRRSTLPMSDRGSSSTISIDAGRL